MAAWWAGLVVALGLIVSALVHGGIYTTVVAGSGGGGAGIPGEVRAWRVNEFTGDISVCVGWQCRSAMWTEPR